MNKCENCEMTDEYCASGECPNDTLTEQWKRGEYSALSELIKQIEEEDNSRSLSDEYLREQGQCTRDIVPVGEWSYGIVSVVVDYVLPYLKQNAQLKELLRECRNSLEEQSNVRKLYESDVEYRDRYNNKMDLLIKLDEVLK